ncbi:MAG: cysteine dioxygenase family protein [Saprospiraceae bacterium]|nr:cysteine dioxygenase family protein [Saprospiraceae bacterium]
MKAIQHLDELIDILPECSGSDYIKIARNMSIPSEEFEPYACWSGEEYTRNCIARTDDYELLLLCWKEGEETPIHCHFGQECWVYAIEGKLEEERYAEDGDDIVQVDHSIYEEGSLSYMNDEMGYHLLRNVAPGRSMSLHLYMNPIDQCTVYDEDKEKFVLKELSYDSIATEALQDA